MQIKKKNLGTWLTKCIYSDEEKSTSQQVFHRRTIIQIKEYTYDLKVKLLLGCHNFPSCFSKVNPLVGNDSEKDFPLNSLHAATNISFFKSRKPIVRCGWKGWSLYCALNKFNSFLQKF